ncbi:MAG: DUF4124 domain-containing protein [Pseudomonadota bacterium]
MPVRTRHALPVVLCLAMLPLLASEAAGYTYRWTDTEGNPQYGDTLPSGTAKRGYQVIDPSTGEVVHEVAPRKTAEEKAREAAEEAAKEQARQAAEEQARKDRILLALYSSVEDIERARDQRLSRLDRRIKELTESIDRLQQRLDEGRGDRADANQLRELTEARARLRFEHQEIETKFEKEIQRFRELKEEH